MKKLRLFFALLLLVTTVSFAQSRKGAYSNTNDRLYSDISSSYSIADKQLGGVWGSYFTHQGNGAAVGYEALTRVDGSGVISLGFGIGTSNYHRNNESGLSNSDHYFHVGLLACIDGWHGNIADQTAEEAKQHQGGQPKSTWILKPAASFAMTYLSRIDDEDTKSGSVELQSFSHYSKDYGFTTRTEVFYHVNEWLSPGIMYSSMEGFAPQLGFDITNSFKVKLGYAFDQKQIMTSLVFDEFF